MKKHGLLPLLILISSPALADGFYRYKGGDQCVLKKFANKAWAEADVGAIEGSVFPIQISRANPNAAVFAVKGTTYGTKKDCLEETDAPAGAVAASSSAGNTGKRKPFLEARLGFLSTSGSAGTVVDGGLTTVTQNYSPSVNLAGRFGWGATFWAPRDNFFGEVGYFSGSQKATANTTNLGEIDDKVLSLDIGYQHYFSMRGKFTPFASFALGYNHLSGTGTFTGAAYTFSASGIGEYIEAGTLYDLSAKWQLNGSLSYHFMSFSPTVADTNNAATFPVGTNTSTFINPASHNNLGINLGVRYTL